MIDTKFAPLDKNDFGVIIANFGNDSIALIQWLKEKSFENITVLSVDTQWAAPMWQTRVAQAENWLQSLGFRHVRLKAKAGFSELIQHRGNFPTPKLQWCAGFLKGLPILEWLDSPQGDPEYQATILLAHRSESSPSRKNLPEYVEESEHYNERSVWHPLLHHRLKERNRLIQSSGFSLLPHRALECDPCVNSDPNDWLRLSESSVYRTQQLEKLMQQPMFDYPKGCSDLFEAIQSLKAKGNAWQAQEDADLFEMGCGSPYGCGQ